MLHPGEDGYWVAEVPSLPVRRGGQGKSKEEAIANIREAIGQWIDAARKLGRRAPR